MADKKSNDKRKARRAAARAAGTPKPLKHFPVEPTVTLFLESRRVRITETGKVLVRDFKPNRIRANGRWIMLEEPTKWRKFHGAKAAIEQPPGLEYTGVTALLTGWLRAGFGEHWGKVDAHKELHRGMHARPGQTIKELAA